MELQFDKTVCRCLKQAVWEIQNQEQTQEVKLPDSLPDIGRVLSAWGQVILRSKEWRGDGMNASGGVMTWVMYLPEDGSEPQCIETWVPFQVKWNFPETEREGVIRLQPMLRSVDARTVSARKMMVRVNVAVQGEALEPWETELYQPGDRQEQVEILRDTYPVRLPKVAGEKTFLLDEELTLPTSCPAADKILRFDILPQIVDQKVMAGKAVFRGTTLLHILYRCTDGALASWDFEIPFSQYGELEEESGPGADVRISMAVTSLEMDLTEDGLFRLKCGLVAQYVVTDLMMIELARDAYSLRRSVVPRMQELKLPAILDARTETVHGEQSAQVENGRVIDVSFLADVPRQSRTGDRVEAELPGLFQVLYADPDGLLQSTVLRQESRWEIDADPDGRLQLEVIPALRPQAVIGAGMLTAKGGMTLSAVTMADQVLEMMTGMEIGEMMEPDSGRPSLILRRAGAERLWDLAKRCGTTVAAIRQANEIAEEPAEGQMLLIPIP